MRRAICSRKLFRATPSTAYENKSTNRNRTFHLLNKPDILTCYEQFGRNRQVVQTTAKTQPHWVEARRICEPQPRRSPMRPGRTQ